MWLATWPRCAGGSFALIFLGCAIGMVLGHGLFGRVGSYERYTLFLATCAILAAVVYYAGEKVGEMIEWFAEHKERK